MAGKKSNIATYLDRVHIVQEMLLSGFKRREILLYVDNNKDELKWNVSDSQVDKYIIDANKNLIADYEKDTIKLKAKYNARYDFIYKKAIGLKDFGLAAAVNEKSTKLNIAPEPTQVQYTGSLSISSKEAKEISTTLDNEC